MDTSLNLHLLQQIYVLEVGLQVQGRHLLNCLNLSGITELRIGDVIATGTPEGVGFSRKPPRFLQHGDVVEVVIERVGTLRNVVA